MDMNKILKSEQVNEHSLKRARQLKMSQAEPVFFPPKLQAARSSIQRVRGHEDNNEDGNEEAPIIPFHTSMK